MLNAGMNKLKGDQFEAALLKPGDDFTEQATLDAVGLWEAVVSIYN